MKLTYRVLLLNIAVLAIFASTFAVEQDEKAESDGMPTEEELFHVGKRHDHGSHEDLDSFQKRSWGDFNWFDKRIPPTLRGQLRNKRHAHASHEDGDSLEKRKFPRGLNTKPKRVFESNEDDSLEKRGWWEDFKSVFSKRFAGLADMYSGEQSYNAGDETLHGMHEEEPVVFKRAGLKQGYLRSRPKRGGFKQGYQKTKMAAKPRK